VPKQTITRKAADNDYFHRDFHIALNYAIGYLHEHFGEEAVREYLVQFADAWYSPLKQAVLENGLSAIKAHYENIYTLEAAEFDMQLSDEELLIHLFASPAVVHIKSNGHAVSPLFHETVVTVNREICRDTPFACELLHYDADNGGYRLRFFRRAT